MPMYLAYPPNRYLSRTLRVFIDWIMELMREQAQVAGSHMKYKSS